MNYVASVIAILVGIALISFRNKFAEMNQRANAAAFPGHFEGSGWRTYATIVPVVVGVGFIAFGILFLVV